MSDSNILTGDVENALAINSTVLFWTQENIFDAMKKEPKHIQVKNGTKNFYFQDKYRDYVRGKKKLFERKYNLLAIVHIIKTISPLGRSYYKCYANNLTSMCVCVTILTHSANNHAHTIWIVQNCILYFHIYYVPLYLLTCAKMN